MKVTAIICAAGKGERAGFEKNKLLVPLFGAPALYHTLEKFNIPEIDEVIVTSSESDFEEISAISSAFSTKVIVGGDTRTQSVKNALLAATGEIVLIHDGARPYLSEKLIKDCIDGVIKYRSAICAINASDTVISEKDGKQTRLDRKNVYLVQTPQGFFTEDIKKAYALAGDKNYTDDSAVYAMFLGQPHLIEGETQNKKLTFKSDFLSALPFEFSGDRCGFGVDVHAFGEGNLVTLGGVKIECDRRLIAHSDGDVLIHAVMDALLSAAGLSDIGHYFPDTDENFRGADSMKMLEEVVRIIESKGYSVKNISVSVQAEKPKLSKHIEKIKDNLSKVLKISTDGIAVAAGTCEGLGFVGEGLGITSYCVAALKNI